VPIDRGPASRTAAMVVPVMRAMRPRPSRTAGALRAGERKAARDLCAVKLPVASRASVKT
jgi:hypothetical protein